MQAAKDPGHDCEARPSLAHYRHDGPLVGAVARTLPAKRSLQQPEAVPAPAAAPAAGAIFWPQPFVVSVSVLLSSLHSLTRLELSTSTVTVQSGSKQLPPGGVTTVTEVD